MKTKQATATVDELRQRQLDAARGLIAGWKHEQYDLLTALFGADAVDARDWVCSVIEAALAREGDKVQRRIETRERRGKGRVA